MQNKEKNTSSMGTSNYKSNLQAHQEEIELVTKLFLDGHKITEISQAFRLKKSQCFKYVKQGLDSYETSRKPGKKLQFSDRRYLEFEHQTGKSNYAIAKVLKCHPTTVANELLRSKGNFYTARKGQKDYNRNKRSYQKKHKLQASLPLLEAYRKSIDNEDHESPYSFVESARQGEIKGLEKRADVVCAKTLYNWINAGAVDFISPEDLPYFGRRRESEAPSFNKEDGKHTSGNSIDLRPEIPVDENGNATQFGNWEIDTVLGTKDKDEPALLVLVERKTRYSIICKIDSKTAENVNKFMAGLKDFVGPKWPEVFRTVTTDNGSEFLKLPKVKGMQKRTFYCHPGCPKEKPVVERTNEMIRVFIPKGKKISGYSDDFVWHMNECLNKKHRAVLNGSSAENLFEAEMDWLHAA